MHFYGLPGVGDGHPSNKVADNLNRYTEVYGPIAEHAEAKGIRIAFETAGRGGGEGNIAHNPELWAAMFEAVPSKALGLSFDPSHLLWLGIDDISGLIQEFGDRIYHVDGKDADIVRDRLLRQGILGSSWWRYRLPGNGELELAGNRPGPARHRLRRRHLHRTRRRSRSGVRRGRALGPLSA